MMASLRIALTLVVATSCGRIGFDDVTGGAGGAGSLVQHIAVGDQFSCAIRADASVWCWGDDAFGVIGKTDGVPQPRPVQIAGLAGATAIAAGAASVCAIVGNGEVWCWGEGDHGELGDGQEGSQQNATPQQVLGLAAPATQLSLGDSYGCALLADGTGDCWGYNDQGQIAGIVEGVEPVTAMPVDDLVEIAAGDVHMVVRRGDGSVWTWGYADNGRLGRDGDGDPAPIPGFTTTSIAAADSSCAVVGQGSYSCWGYDDVGQLGAGTSGDSEDTPNPPSALTGVVSIAMADKDVCALLSDHTVQCWGRNEYGELGAGDRADRTLPVAVQISGVVSLSARGDHVCAAESDGTVACWGRGSSGELGDGTLGTFAPHQVSLGANVTAVAAGDSHTCAIAGISLLCWGQGEDGELGDGLMISHALPTVVSIAAPSAVAAGSQHTCATDSTGRASCWGSNLDGQLGDGGPETTSATPVMVAGAVQFTSLAAGAEFSSGISPTNVIAWGADNVGQLGDANNSEELTPVQVMPSIPGLFALAAGDDNSCALGTGGAIACWGGNDNGELGDGTIQPQNTPTATCSNITNSTKGACLTLIAPGGIAIATRGEHTCVVLTGGQVACWGLGGAGQLGDGNYQARITPGLVAQLSDAASIIAASDNATCVATAAGVSCWGENSLGVLGDGTSLGAGTPRVVPGLGMVTALAMGSDHACAIDASGALWCWGDNAHGEQGTGTFSRALSPTMVQFP